MLRCEKTCIDDEPGIMAVMVTAHVNLPYPILDVQNAKVPDVKIAEGVVVVHARIDVA